MNLIHPSDPQYFTETCSKPYDRHQYKIVYYGGDHGHESQIVDSWEEARELWWNSIPQFISHIEVLDKPKKQSKGFK